MGVKRKEKAIMGVEGEEEEEEGRRRRRRKRKISYLYHSIMLTE